MSVIIVVEPHPLLRLGILQLLSTGLPDYQVTGVDYSALSKATPEDKGCDLLILAIPSFEDIHRLTAAAVASYEPASILLLSEDTQMPDWVHHCPPVVAGYVAKNVAPEVLQASVRLVLAGGTCFPLRSTPTEAANHAPQAILPSRAEAGQWPNEPNAPLILDETSTSECEKLGLTPRQYEVLVLLARGYPLKTVGRLLNISVATAKAHTEMLYQRLDVHSRNAAV